jgi:hypothetical protein
MVILSLFAKILFESNVYKRLKKLYYSNLILPSLRVEVLQFLKKINKIAVP